MLKRARPNCAAIPRSQTHAPDSPCLPAPAFRDHSPGALLEPPRSRRGPGRRRTGRRGRATEAGAAPLKYQRNARLSLKEAPNSFEDITTYNNFYEFGTGKADPAERSRQVPAAPWCVAVAGECGKSRAPYTLEDILKPHALEERIYRLRCVEAWSMVIPWVGFRSATCCKRFEPDLAAPSTSRSRRCCDPSEMPGQRCPGARLALRRGPAHRRGHAPADAAGRRACMARRCPTRTARRCGWSCRGSTASRASSRSSRSASPRRQPPTSWNLLAPREYGFYANVNPAVDHPRWSQAKERRIGAACSRRKQPTRCRSTATPTRSQRCTRAWTCASTTEAGRRCDHRPGIRGAFRADKPLVFVLCLLPLAWLALRAFDVAGLALGANPVEALLHAPATRALRLLLLTLA